MSSVSIPDRERIGSGRIDQIVTQVPFVLILEIDSPDGEAENVARGDILNVFGTRVHVREIKLRDKATDVYRFRAEVALFLTDLRTRAIILRAYETQEVDENAYLEPVPF